MDRLSFQDLHRFIASLGIVMIAVALALPWLYLRETSSAYLTVQEYAALTQSGQRLARERQRLAVLAIAAVPWVAVTMGVAGLVVLRRGLDKWGPLQRVRDDAEVRTLTIEEAVERVFEESSEDAQANLRGMAEMERPGSTEARSRAGNEAGSVATTAADNFNIRDVNSIVLRAAMHRMSIERGVANLLRSGFGAGNVRTQIAIGRYQVDAYVRTPSGRRLLVEAKTARDAVGARRTARLTLTHLDRARTAMGRHADLLVVLVVPDDVAEVVREELLQWQERGDKHVVVIPESAVFGEHVGVFADLIKSLRTRQGAEGHGNAGGQRGGS